MARFSNRYCEFCKAETLHQSGARNIGTCCVHCNTIQAVKTSGYQIKRKEIFDAADAKYGRIQARAYRRRKSKEAYLQSKPARAAESIVKPDFVDNQRLRTSIRSGRERTRC